MAVVPRPAATVILIRDDAGALQVFLQRRVSGMAFAGGMTVFPGGGVDPVDHTGAPWSGPPAGWWAERLACDDALAAALVRAAVRETFEECGVLLAGPGPMVDQAAARTALVARHVTLDEVLIGAGLVLDAGRLRPWARWITPEASPKRYDTAFFVAAVPAGQATDAHTTEAVEAAWWTPAEALSEAASGGMAMMRPTLHCLRELAALTDVAAVLAAAGERVIEPVRPTVLSSGAIHIAGHDDVADPGRPVP